MIKTQPERILACTVKGRTKGLKKKDITFSGKWSGFIEKSEKGEEPDKLVSMVWWTKPAKAKVVAPVSQQRWRESRRKTSLFYFYFIFNNMFVTFLQMLHKCLFEAK